MPRSSSTSSHVAVISPSPASSSKSVTRSTRGSLAVSRFLPAPAAVAQRASAQPEGPGVSLSRLDSGPPFDASHDRYRVPRDGQDDRQRRLVVLGPGSTVSVAVLFLAGRESSARGKVAAGVSRPVHQNAPAADTIALAVCLAPGDRARCRARRSRARARRAGLPAQATARSREPDRRQRRPGWRSRRPRGGPHRERNDQQADGSQVESVDPLPAGQVTPRRATDLVRKPSAGSWDRQWVDVGFGGRAAHRGLLRRLTG